MIRYSLGPGDTDGRSGVTVFVAGKPGVVLLAQLQKRSVRLNGSPCTWRRRLIVCPALRLHGIYAGVAPRNTDPFIRR